MQTHSNKGGVLRGEAGFTLVEMMMALLITGFVGSAILLAYQAQQKTQVVQEQIAELQANMRAAMTMISSDIRMIGFDPTCKTKAGLVTAKQGEISFTMNRTFETAGGEDNTVLTDPNEDITYHLDTESDPTQRGVATVKGQDSPSLKRVDHNAGGDEPVVNNVEAIEFLYKIGNDWYVNPEISGKNVGEIEAVTISMLIRTTYEDPKYTGNNESLRPASQLHHFQVQGGQNNDWGKYVNSIKDKHRRRVAIATVQLRNYGRCEEEGL